MPVTDETPQVSRGFQALQHVLFRKAPVKLRLMVYNGKLIRSVTHTRRAR